MPYPIENKLVIAVASSALFDLSESDKVYREQGVEAYRTYQEENLDNTLSKGVAFPFIRRFLNLNTAFSGQEPVEVILLSRNSPETGMRVFRSIQKYGLDISRAAFFSGTSPHEYIPAYNASLFLSANEEDVQNAIGAGYPAGRVIETRITDDEKDPELRIAFDFDGVIADDAAEMVYKKTKDIEKFHAMETQLSLVPHNPGPLQDLFRKISFLQELENKKKNEDPGYNRLLKIAIVTARSAPAHERMVNTLKSWGISADEAFFLGGIEKKRVLEIMKPHIYFDDQIVHLEHMDRIPLVHIPFGIANVKSDK
ncbi:MAG: 5'-nucleotidase [Bacteroidales bacterium]|nr:5'-nucleotidase [Bacteroidales bacterium]MBN2761669.1 5'-nucleotidase [Bacteroidales bacterium]